MKKAKYYYDKKSLSYKRIEKTWKHRLKNISVFMFASAFFGLIMVFAAFNFFDSPKEKMLKRELDKLKLQYELMDKSLNQISAVLENIKDRDDNIYRVIFEAEPIPNSIRKAGIGGVNRYKDLEGYDNTEILVSTVKKIDQISKQLYIQSKSFDEVIEMAQRKSDMMASIPAIQPVKNNELKRIASGYGRRIDPYYKKLKFHYGVDFSAPKGTPIYATGDGVVAKTKRSKRGFGNHVVIDHGYGYESLYAHMTKYTVRNGQKVRRGDIIGYVGSSGKSTAPHLHYEVHKDGKKINPAYYFHNDLSPEEFDRMLELSSQENQSFD
ncbi:M23 family metallopeptidase [Flavobacteriales bacterium]|jgi:murein DD-endopeptidase MepM/ murein hydrolase activator NlpD|nr:M23 family metallopeptidase [Flavobacteriales bacterium]